MLRDLNFERQLLGAILRKPGILGTKNIHEELFSLDSHRALFRLAQQRFIGGEDTDGGALMSWLAEHDSAEEFGGFQALQDIVDAGVRKPKGLVDTLRRLASKRVAISAMEQARAGLSDPDQSPDVVIGELVASLTGDIASGSHLSKLKDTALPAFLEQEGRIHDGTTRRIKTGVREFDQVFNGISGRGVSLFIGASGMGKTTMANRLIVGMAMQGHRVMVHGTETTESERTEDLMYSVARVSPDEFDWLTGRGDDRIESESARLQVLYRRLRDAADLLSTLPITISSKAKGTVEVVCARARALHAGGKLDILVADYLQDFSWSHGIRSADMSSQVMHASSHLKELSADLSIPVILTAQRSDEKSRVTKDNARPQMYDTQWSSRAHQDAEEVYALFRNDYYTEVLADWDEYFGAKGVVEVIRRKVRRGQKGAAELAWDGPSRWVGSDIERFPKLQPFGRSTQ